MSKAEYFIQNLNSLRYFHGEVISLAYLIGICEFRATSSRISVNKNKVNKNPDLKMTQLNH